MNAKPSLKAVAQGSAGTTLCVGLIVLFNLYLNPPFTRMASCKFNMSSGIWEFFDDIELIHMQFKHCIFNATDGRNPEFEIHQFTAILDHDSKKDTSFQVYFDVTLAEMWHKEQLEAHVRHLFTAHTKAYCNFPFALFRGKCDLRTKHICLNE